MEEDAQFPSSMPSSIREAAAATLVGNGTDRSCQGPQLQVVTLDMSCTSFSVFSGPSVEEKGKQRT